MDIEKLRTKKFIKNIIVGCIALGVVAFLLNIVPGYKRDKFIDITNLVINENNVTEELAQEIYINDRGVIYLSKEDIERFFDTNIYYDEKYSQVITTSDTQVASLVLEELEMTMNNSTIDILDTIIWKDDILYIPISEMEEIYNIEVRYISETDFVIIDEKSKGMITADVIEDVNLKFKPRQLSKDVSELKEGESVSCFYTTSTGWRQIRRENGETGYIKANKLENDYIVRQDATKREEAESIYINSKGIARVNKNGKTVNVVIRELFKIISQDSIGIDEDVNKNIDMSVDELWTTISNKGVEKQVEIFLSDYKMRNELINSIVRVINENELQGVNINFNNIVNEENFERFVIELTPRLRAMEKSTCVTINKNMNKDNIKNIVDYIIE